MFQLILAIDGRGISYKIALRWMSLDVIDDKLTLVQVTCLVPSGNKPLPEPMLTLIYVVTWLYYESILFGKPSS